MGVSTYVYVGPFIKSEKCSISSIKRVKTCSNPDCTNHIKNKEINGKFCSECGSATSFKEYLKKEFVCLA